MDRSHESSTAQQRPIPGELIEKIIEELAQREGLDYLSLTDDAEDQLKQCALVNHTFRLYSQQHLFWHLEIQDEERISRVARTIQASGRIRDTLRSIALNCFAAASNQGIFQALLQAQNIERITLLNCSRFAFALGHLYKELFHSLPRLTIITARGGNAFPILLLRDCTALKTLRFDVPSINAHHGLAWEPSVSSEDNLVALHALEISLRQRNQWIPFFHWLLDYNIQNECFLDIRGLKRLTFRGIDPRDAGILIEPLQAVIDLAKETLSSFSIDELSVCLSLNLRQFENLCELRLLLPSPSFRPALELFPTIIEWTTNNMLQIKTLIIECTVHPTVAFAGGAGHRDNFFARWRAVDDAFKASEKDLPELRKVVFLINWFVGDVHNYRIRDEMPYLYLQRKILEIIDAKRMSL